MATRLRKLHQEDVRAKIQTSQIVNRLMDHLLGVLELSATQIRAAEILIKKTLPDLQAVEMTGANGGAIQFETTVDPTGLSDEQLRALASIPVSGRDSSEEGTGEAPPDRLH